MKLHVIELDPGIPRAVYREIEIEGGTLYGIRLTLDNGEEIEAREASWASNGLELDTFTAGQLAVVGRGSTGVTLYPVANLADSRLRPVVPSAD